MGETTPKIGCTGIRRAAPREREAMATARRSRAKARTHRTRCPQSGDARRHERRPGGL